MKNRIWTIMKKELTRFFTDRRLIFTTILMPGVLIYLLYSLMGSAIAGMYTPEAGVSVPPQAESARDAVRVMPRSSASFFFIFYLPFSLNRR